MGDFNIDLLNNSDYHKMQLLGLLATYLFQQHINNPTRISSTSKTLIDNIFSNVINTEFTNGIFYYDISDHLPVFTINNSFFQNNTLKIKNLKCIIRKQKVI